jgi:hypothetical protein
MSPKRKTTMFVIFAGPQQHGRPGALHIAKDGKTKTKMRSHAAELYSFAEAQEFAKKMNIQMTAFR